MEQLRNLLTQADPATITFYLWALLLIVGMPLLLLVLSEWLERWRRQSDTIWERLSRPLAQVRNLVLPLLSLRLILAYILQVDSNLFSVRLVETLLWLVILYSALGLIAQLARSPGTVGEGEFSLPRVWGELLRAALMLGIGFYVLGGLWGAPMEQVFAALGVGSIVIGFALQDTLGNLVAGLFLAFEKPFQVGHWVRYGLFEGQVIEMNWRVVRLRTRERDVVIVPNATMGKEAVINFTLLDPLHAELIQLAFDYAHAPNQIKRLLLETCLATPGVVHEPPPHIRVHSYNYEKHAVNYEIKLFLLDYLRTEFIREAKMAGAILERTTLAGAALSAADLSGANLVQSDLTGAWLNLTNLVGANLTEANLAGISLVGAMLASTNLQGSNLRGAILVGAHLDGANLRSATLHDARTTVAQLPERTLQLDPLLQQLTELQRNALLQDADLAGVAFDARTIMPDGTTADVSSAGRRLTLALGSSTQPTATAATAATAAAPSTLVDANGLPLAKQVFINFFVNSLRNINPETGHFTGDFYLDLSWQEPTLRDEQALADLDPAQLWHPRPLLINSTNGRFVYEAFVNSPEPGTNIRMSSRVIGDFAATFELRNFPFGQQNL